MQFSTETEDDVKLIHLIEDGETLMTVAPEYGAKLKSLKMQKNGQYHELLWPISVDDLKTNDWYKSTILFPYPNRLEDGKYSFEGKDYQFPINEPDKNNQLHGMLYNEPFSVTAQRADGDSASIELSYVYDGDKSYYPFPFIFSVKYTYSRAGFAVDFQVTNKGNQKLPFGLGWHPYFQIDGNSIDTCSIVTPKLELIRLSDRSLPTGERLAYEQNPIKLNDTSLDNAFKIKDAKNAYELQDKKSGVTLRFTASQEMDYMQIFTPSKETVAIEPMTCNINAFNNGDGLKTLDPQEIFRAKFQIAVG